MNSTPFSFYVNRYEGLSNIPEFGSSTKKQLQSGKVLVIGMGGLGTPCALYLTAAGIGTLGISEEDIISEDNLSRQILFDSNTIGLQKKEQAIKKLSKINPLVSFKSLPKVNPENIFTIFKDFDFIIDATDNIVSKLLINDTCVKMKKAFCYAGVIQARGICMTIIPPKTRCCRCVFPELSSSIKIGKCSQEGIFAPIAGMLGLIQASEAIKFYTKTGDLLTNRVFSIEALQWKTKIFDVSKKSSCNKCSTQMEPVS